MRLGLSSAAAPDASLEDLLEACGRRGLAALELRDGDAHGLEPRDTARAQDAARSAAAAGVALAGYRTAGDASDAALAGLSVALGAPVLLDEPAGVAGRVERAAEITRLGGSAAVVVGGQTAAEDGALVAALGIEVAWDADPAAGPVGEQVGALLARVDQRLALIRLAGGGPEALGQAGQGIGELMGRLALSGYDGAVVLAPTSSRYRVAWQTWLGRGGGWGCGSKAAALPLVSTTGGKR
ncbi:MAG: hypothetical protein KJ051_11855 [Thermoleophilia bacterium]|nr:hypothetical protein [Thermoleophilia bacterium]